MSFSSPSFVLVFLPAFLLTYRLVRPSLRLPGVLVASLVFLTAGQPTALPWLAGLGLAGYAFGRLIEARLARGRNASPFLWAGIGLNLGILLAFKWLAAHPTGPITLAGFRIETIVLPLGLSYLVFQIIAYLADVSQGDTPAEKNLVNFTTYVLFFPKLVAGPITKYQAIADQIRSLDPSEKDAAAGLGRILAGEAKRVFIAGPLGLFVDAAFNRPHADLAPPLAWLALSAFALQIYYDFSGYTDIAIGLGKVIGVRLPENFRHPFVSQSISELWRRWHMTLLAWFREYVFYPLERHRLRWAGQQINLIMVFFLTGLWHSPTWNFVLWGLINGLALAFESTAAGRWWIRKAWRPIRHLYFAFIFLVSLAFFRAATLSLSWEWLGRLAGSRTGLAASAGEFRSPGISLPPWLPAVMVLALILSLPWRQGLRARWEQSQTARRLARFMKKISSARAAKRGADFLWARRGWWLVPMALVFIVFGLLAVLTETLSPSPFIYAGF
jgi:alginate O-acetyltransferase complex protein AlgI